jgi:ATP-dependent protease ClpP protease subunit
MSVVGINFHGPITHPASVKLRNVICSAVNERIQNGPDAGKRNYEKIYLLINSLGGVVDDGMSIFGLLRSLPIEVVTVNTGMVASAAILAFLGGKKRIAFPHSIFHFHDYEWNYTAAHNMTRLEYMDHTQILESGRQTTLEILKANTSLTDGDLKELKLLYEPVIKDATFAKAKGIIDDINYLAFPEEMNIYNVDY